MTSSGNKHPMPPGLGAAVAVLALLAGCGSSAEHGLPGDGAAGQSGAAGSGGSNGGAMAGNGGSAGVAGQGGQVDAGIDVPPGLPDGSADLRTDAPLLNPTITLLTPSSLPSNTPGTFTLLVDGRDFPADAEVAFETNSWRATFVSPTRLSVQIPGVALGGSPRQASVQVTRTPDPPVYSNILYFTISAPQ